MNWIKKLFNKKGVKQCAIFSVGISNGVKGKYVISYGRSVLYDLYSGDDVCVCKGVNYKELSKIIEMDKIVETTGSNLEYLNYIANNAVNTDFYRLED